MKELTYPIAGRLTRILAGAALAAMAVHVQAAPADPQIDKPGRSAAVHTSGDASEPGTIPAARPGLPPVQRGAEGPLRSDAYAGKSDPSIRDTNPLTVNGLWETRPGNGIAQPRP